MKDDRCEHGVLWSMECLSCGLPEYVAATPPPIPSDAAMRAPESRKCVNCGHGNVNSNNGMCIEFVVPRNSNSGHRCGCKCEFAAPVATAERLDSRDSDVEGDHLQLLRMCLQQFEFTYGQRKRGWDARFLMDRLRAATEHASTAFETPARESVRAAAEAVGEYLQAPPSMWDTIERLITQRLGSPVVAATRATEELLRENFLLSDITAEEFNRVAAIITRHFPQTPEPHCWHCGVVLAYAPKLRCEDCPDECDTEGCDEMGCTPTVPG